MSGFYYFYYLNWEILPYTLPLWLRYKKLGMCWCSGQEGIARKKNIARSSKHSSTFFLWMHQRNVSIEWRLQRETGLFKFWGGKEANYQKTQWWTAPHLQKAPLALRSTAWLEGFDCLQSATLEDEGEGWVFSVPSTDCQHRMKGKSCSFKQRFK